MECREGSSMRWCLYGEFSLWELTLSGSGPEYIKIFVRIQKYEIQYETKFNYRPCINPAVYIFPNSFPPDVVFPKNVN